MPKHDEPPMGFPQWEDANRGLSPTNRIESSVIEATRLTMLCPESVEATTISFILGARWREVTIQSPELKDGRMLPPLTLKILSITQYWLHDSQRRRIWRDNSTCLNVLGGPKDAGELINEFNQVNGVIAVNVLLTFG